MGAALTAPHSPGKLRALHCCHPLLSRKGENGLEKFTWSKNTCAPQKHLDDLSALGIDCCHLAGNYLPIIAVDGSVKRREWQAKIRPSRQGRKREKFKQDTERLIMRNVKRTRLSGDTDP